jgi:hypothetical protein
MAHDPRLDDFSHRKLSGRRDGMWPVHAEAGVCPIDKRRHFVEDSWQQRRDGRGDRGVIDSNIIEKIQKLRAITERRGATEGEAIAAEQRMFRLLAKYNLEISQIPEDAPTRPDTRIESESAQRPSSVWKQFIYTGVANLNFSE